MERVTADGWFSGAQVCVSPHFNARPQGEVVSLLIIHNISLPPGQFGGKHVQAFFRGHLDPDIHPYFTEIADLKVSAHFLIERDGAITQFVSCLDRAWHAGVSVHSGRANCNDYSIGIELEGVDDQPYDDRQYASLLTLTHSLQRAYPAITPYRITGHEQVAPGRKTDPGPAFDWRRFLSAVGRFDGRDTESCR